MIDIREDNVLFLLGAGASYEADIPISFQMVNEVEELVLNSWKEYRELYYYIKSCINYSQGIIGNFDNYFNIETLLIVIGELQKRERNPVYPFIGTWNNRLVELAGPRFEVLHEFKQKIVEKLNDWVLPVDYSKAEYYSGFSKFQDEIGTVIRVFTLNYDLCFEQIVGRDSEIMDGFTFPDNIWNYTNFVDVKEDYCLYKLHGSIDWVPLDHTIQKIAHPGSSSKPELIFGVEAKLRSKDPYLFYIGDFRKYMFTPDCKLLITIGYSFSDAHINDIISQAIRQSSTQNILIVSPLSVDTDEKIKTEIKRKQSQILKLLGLDDFFIGRIKIFNGGAKDFLLDNLSSALVYENMSFEDDENLFEGE